MPKFLSCPWALLLVLVCTPSLASGLFGNRASADFLPSHEAFVLDAVALDGQHIEARWLIAPGYYLYRHRLAFELVDADGEILAQIPQGAAYEDEFFGEVEIYRDMLSVLLTPPADRESLVLQVRYQGCAEAGLCYPPQSRQFHLHMTGQ